MSQTLEKTRCFGAHNPLYAEYHDKEWGRPVHDDHLLFEILTLEGAQAGLSWETVLKKRESYKEFFHQFDPKLVAEMGDEELETILQNKAIIRNKLKIYSVRKNARIFIKIQQEFGSFDQYIWQFVNFTPIKNHPQTLKDIPPKTVISDQISKDLKKRGMSFVGTTIIYAFMQAVGMVNDHIQSCWCYKP
ncbi:DNA-3-methyladenine glycosylase 1 [Candidatus Rubidus massiliensis]|nr:DNA-3-methyladenine glycosylase 1 [Candidatus Rubidus massiliensis]